jgi:hypothetical protein
MQKTRYEAVVVEFEAYKANIARLADMRKIENEILRKQAVASLADAQKTYDNNLKAIKNEYLKKQKLDSVTIGDLRSRVRDTITADSVRLPETVADSSWTAEQWSDSYRALVTKYESLVLACSVTTNDYNLLRDWADASCKQVGCE